jgi:hypothetical protein
VKTYYGTKVVQAEPGENVSSGAAGYKIVYPDGYESWSPKAVFEASYRQDGEMTFGHALYALKAGLKVARSGWNGKDMFLFLVAGSVFQVNRPPLNTIYPNGTEVTYHAHIDMKTAQGYVVPWLASQADVLDEDWCIVG